MKISYRKHIANSKVSDILGKRVKFVHDGNEQHNPGNKKEAIGKIISFGACGCEIYRNHYSYTRKWDEIEFV